MVITREMAEYWPRQYCCLPLGQEFRYFKVCHLCLCLKGTDHAIWQNYALEHCPKMMAASVQYHRPLFGPANVPDQKLLRFRGLKP